MSASESLSNWDLTPVIELLHSFRGNSQPYSDQPDPAANGVTPSNTEDGLNRVDDYPRLGDFTPVWEYLAQHPSHCQHGSPNKREGGLHSVGGSQPSEPNDAPGNSGLKDRREEAASEKTEVLLYTSTPKNGIKRTEETLVVPTRPRQVLRRLPVHSQGDLSLNANDSALGSRNLNGSIDHASSGSRNGHLKPPFSESRPKQIVQPILTGSSTVKKQSLISKLCERFQNERKVLQRPELTKPAYTLSNTSTKGIHVFVDMSNIAVGFHDQIKKARNIPITTKVPRLPLSFHNLSLVLERGRPVCKRVLVGSDRFPAIDEAEKLGYEINILERVQKVKDTPRKKNLANGYRSNGGKPVGNKVHDETSEPETRNTGSQLPRWVEQAVDEVLHLKMLESLVDTTEPSTIVLATGDAGEAEYSDGFMRMVERALAKGWRVELVGFGSNMSGSYIKKAFGRNGNRQFAIIFLETYCEYLLEM